MNAPTRWRDDPSAPQGVRDALSAGRPSRRLPGDARRRSAARLDRLIAVPAAAGLVLWIKGAAVASLCVAGAVAVVHEIREPTPAPVVPERPRPREHASPVRLTVPEPMKAPLDDATPTLLAAADAGTPATTRTVHHVERAARSPDPSVPDALEREAVMLENARAMLDKNPSGALAALDRYTALFPSGVLTIERDLLAVDALRRLGRSGEARTRAAGLLERARGTLYEPRIRAMMDE
jgi:hypothetical protein